MIRPDQKISEAVFYPPEILSDWSGGMRMNVSFASLEKSEYALLRNGRSRYGKIAPVRLPVKEAGLPSGNYQGCYTFNSKVLVFVDGKAYIRDYASTNSFFRQNMNFAAMSSVTDFIFACGVPASLVNLGRQSSATDKSAAITLLDNVEKTPQCIICQDGSSRPRLIISDSASRYAKDFHQWSYLIPEYVPVGKQMLYHDGKLYIVNENKVYHSVTGRPLDFVIAVDDSGEKLTDSAYSVEADRLSFSASWNDITCLASLNIQDQMAPPFLLATGKACYSVQPNKDSLIYGEPVFSFSELFSVGINNQNSITGVVGDYGFISSSGIHTFNAVAQFRREGNNAPIFQSVAKLFEDVVQDYTCVATYNNYIFAAIKTIYGYGVLVFDTLNQRFVALDMYPGITAIKQFCVTLVDGIERLFFITASGFYEAFAGDFANCEFFVKEWSTGDAEIEHRLNRVKAVFQDTYETGTVSVTEYADQKVGVTLTKQLTAEISRPGTLSFPLGDSSVSHVDNRLFKFTGTKRCLNVGLKISWNFDTVLEQLQVTTDRISGSTSLKDQAAAYENS